MVTGEHGDDECCVWYVIRPLYFQVRGGDGG